MCALQGSYDQEVEAFRRHLETVYRLCHQCQASVDRELDKQDYLLQTKLDSLRKGAEGGIEQEHRAQVGWISGTISYRPNWTLEGGWRAIEGDCMAQVSWISRPNWLP